MSKNVNRNHPMAQRVYRLHLLEGIYREISFRSSAYAHSPACGCHPDPATADMLRLKEALPVLESEEQADWITEKIEAALAGCQSELVRTIPPGNIAHYMRLAYRQSIRTSSPQPLTAV